MAVLPINSTRLVADVGGTNTRVALFDETSGEFRALAIYINREYKALGDIFAQWLAALAETAPQKCCIAVAAPPTGDRVTMTNMDWSFSCKELAARFGFQQLRRLNDFESNAYGLPYLATGDCELLYPGQAGQNGRLATLGPGTGLGGAVLDTNAGHARSFACEPGHMGISPGSALELEVFRLLLPRHGNIYAELLVSGPGLLRLYQALAEVRGEPAQELTPTDVSRQGLANENELCALAVTSFCELLGSVCGDFLLANGAYGGLYLAGGIIPKMLPGLRGSRFHQRLTDKGNMAGTLAGVPIYVITTGQPGLIGAAHAPL